MASIVPQIQVLYKNIHLQWRSLCLFIALILLSFFTGYRIGATTPQPNVRSVPLTIQDDTEGISLLAYEQHQRRTHETNNNLDESTSQDNEIDDYQSTTQSDIVVIASQTGTKYYYPWCSGLSRIKEENRIYLPNETVAEEAGLERATKCEK